MRLPKEPCDTAPADRPAENPGFHSCGSQRNLATLISISKTKDMVSFHSCGSQRNLVTDRSSYAWDANPLFPFMRLPKEPCDIFSVSSQLLLSLFPFMRLPKEPCDFERSFSRQMSRSVSIHAAPKGTLRPRTLRTLCQ